MSSKIKRQYFISRVFDGVYGSTEKLERFAFRHMPLFLYEKIDSLRTNLYWKTSGVVVSDICCNFLNEYVVNKEFSAEEILFEYIEVMNIVGRRLGIGKKAGRITLYESWNFSLEEHHSLDQDCKDRFAGYLSYCSDRWCISRFLRVQSFFLEWGNSKDKNFTTNLIVKYDL